MNESIIKVFESVLNEAETTKYMACCYDPEDYYEETNYIDEDGELSCSSSGAKLFNTEDEAIEYAEDNRPYGWASFAMPAVCKPPLKEDVEGVPKITYKTIEDALYQWYIYQLDFNSNFSDERTKEAYGDIFDIVKASSTPSFGLINKIIHKIEWYGYDSWQFKKNIYSAIKESKESFFDKLSESKKKLKEMTQDEFNRLARRRDEFRTQTAISPAEKNNLYADIKDFEEEFRDLQDTAERLPDAYIDQVCDTASYPFEVAIDEVKDVEDWCSEAEEFLKDDISNWGIIEESSLSKKRLKETFDSTSAAFNLTLKASEDSSF